MPQPIPSYNLGLLITLNISMTLSSMTLSGILITAISCWAIIRQANANTTYLAEVAQRISASTERVAEIAERIDARLRRQFPDIGSALGD